MATRNLTVSDLYSQIRRAAHEPTTIRFSDDDLLAMLNDAQEDFVSKLYGAAPRARFVLTGTVASQQEYPLPDALLSVHAVWFYDGTDWERLRYVPYLEQHGAHYDEEATEPQLYYLRDNLLGLIPVPSSSGTNDLRIYTAYVPDELTAEEDEPFGGSRLLKPFRRILVPHVVAAMKAADSKLDQEAHWMTRFEQGVAGARRHLNLRVSDSTDAPVARVGGGVSSPFDLTYEGSVGTESAPDPDYSP